ncbi:MAG: CDP-glucose 4,6-dehydratase [Phycisphaerae bacterium]
MHEIDSTFWSSQRVVLTGHTGFKGAWLTLWLRRLGAAVRGISLREAPSNPHMFGLLGLSSQCDHHACDVRDAAALAPLVRDFSPTIVFHMAAQALVRRSYREPVATFATNAMGTAHVLEACRDLSGLRAVVVVTTDKCYENREWVHPYRESDPLGGHDPYSASKAAAEIVAASYRRSFFHEGAAAVATARAGNVVGGGDWSEDRLIVDLVRAIGAGRPAVVRNINAVRPWQHVLEPLSGYLMLARALCEQGKAVSPAFNFGPPAEQARTVGEVVKAFVEQWGPEASWRHDPPPNAPHEAGLLMLDPSKAIRELGWRPRLDLATTLRFTAEWYRRFHQGAGTRDLVALCHAQIDAYMGDHSRR